MKKTEIFVCLVAILVAIAVGLVIPVWAEGDRVISEIPVGNYGWLKLTPRFSVAEVENEIRETGLVPYFCKEPVLIETQTQKTKTWERGCVPAGTFFLCEVKKTEEGDLYTPKIIARCGNLVRGVKFLVVREKKIVEVPGPERVLEKTVEVPGPERIIEIPGPERIVEVPGPERIVGVPFYSPGPGFSGYWGGNNWGVTLSLPFGAFWDESAGCYLDQNGFEYSPFFDNHGRRYYRKFRQGYHDNFGGGRDFYKGRDFRQGHDFNQRDFQPRRFHSQSDSGFYNRSSQPGHHYGGSWGHGGRGSSQQGGPGFSRRGGGSSRGGGFKVPRR